MGGWRTCKLVVALTFCSKSATSLPYFKLRAASQQCQSTNKIPEYRLAGDALPDMDPVSATLIGAVVAEQLPESGWYTVAEAAIAALYALHPSPQEVCRALLHHLAATAFMSAEPGAAAGAALSAVSLSHFFFTLGQVALQHLVRPLLEIFSA